jgi:hypothetical protein
MKQSVFLFALSFTLFTQQKAFAMNTPDRCENPRLVLKCDSYSRELSELKKGESAQTEMQDLAEIFDEPQCGATLDLPTKIGLMTVQLSDKPLLLRISFMNKGTSTVLFENIDFKEQGFEFGITPDDKSYPPMLIQCYGETAK